jgi:hypothetical protein
LFPSAAEKPVAEISHPELFRVLRKTETRETADTAGWDGLSIAVELGAPLQRCRRGD